MLNTNFENKNKKIFRKIMLIVLITALGFISYAMWLNYNFHSIGSQTQQQTNISTNNKTNSLKINSLAPDFITDDVYDNQFVLSDFRNKKPVLLVFCATWCNFCTKELPDLKIFSKKYYNNIQVIVILSGEVKETIKNYIKKEKDVNFLILLDETKKIWNQYQVRGTPFHFLITKDGKISTIRPGLALMNDLEIILSILK